MLPDPLHPAVVHLPVALAVLLPILAIAGVALIEREWLPVRAWSLMVVLSAALVLGSWVALETGEHDEERVEEVVAERFIHEHEEAAELFMTIGFLLFVAVAAGTSSGALGRGARIASIPLALALLVAGARVGHLGGELVYKHGAAAAHLDAGAGHVAGLGSNADDDEDSD